LKPKRSRITAHLEHHGEQAGKDGRSHQLPDEGHDERWTPDGWTDVGL